MVIEHKAWKGRVPMKDQDERWIVWGVLLFLFLVIVIQTICGGEIRIG